MKNKVSVIKMLIALVLSSLVFTTIKRLNVITLFSYGLYFFIIIAIWFIFYMFLKNINQIYKRTMLFSSFTAIIISVCYIFGAQLEQTNNILLTKHTALNIVFLAVLLWVILCLVFENIQKLNSQYSNPYLDKFFSKFLPIWIILIIVNIPYLILFNPAVISPDSMSVLLQSTGEIPLHSGHPVFYIILVSLFTNVASHFGIELYYAVLSISIFQILVMDAIVAYMIVTMHKIKVNTACIVFIFIYFAINPLFAIYNVSMWKDVIFGGMVALFSLFLYLAKTKPDLMKTKSGLISLSLITMGVLLFRTNGIAVVFITLIFMLIFFKEHIIKVLLVIGIPISVYILFITLGFNLMNVASFDKNEAFTIPYQHMARIAYENKDLDEVDRDFFDKAFKTDDLTFNPRLSDYIRKGDADIDYFTNNTNEFINSWFRLVKKYPKSLVKSFLNGNYGYWFPDTTNWKVMTSIEENAILDIDRIGYDNSQKGLFNLFNLNILSNTINSIGIQYWILLITATYAIINKRKETYLLFVPSLALWIGVMLATPVYSELRYVYGLYLILPIIIGITFFKNAD